MKKTDEPKPLPLLLWCPGCHVQHVDQGEWATKSHREHLCEHCGRSWTPALVPTVGVAHLGLPSSAEAEREAVLNLLRETIKGVGATSVYGSNLEKIEKKIARGEHLP